MVGDRRPRGTDSLCAKVGHTDDGICRALLLTLGCQFDPWIKDRGYEWEVSERLTMLQPAVADAAHSFISRSLRATCGASTVSRRPQ